MTAPRSWSRASSSNPRRAALAAVARGGRIGKSTHDTAVATVEDRYAQLRTVAIDEPLARHAGNLAAKHAVRGQGAACDGPAARQRHRLRNRECEVAKRSPEIRSHGLLASRGAQHAAPRPDRGRPVTTLTFATVLAMVKPLGRIQGGRTPGFPVYLSTRDKPHSKRAS
jgi:hypothetical protein